LTEEKTMQRKVRTLEVALALVALSLSAASRLHAQGTVPAGTPIVVNLDQSVSSKDAKVGQKIAASVARDVVVGTKVVIPKGSPAGVTVATAVPSGRLQTPAELYLRLDTVEVRGKSYSVSAHLAGRKEGSHKKRNAVAIGGGAVAGALIGELPVAEKAQPLERPRALEPERPEQRSRARKTLPTPRRRS
jgi:hypothetical protein